MRHVGTGAKGEGAGHMGSMLALRDGGAGLWVWYMVGHMSFALQGHPHPLGLMQPCWEVHREGKNREA